MIRNLKMLGLAICAMLALGAMASVASAAEYHSESSTTVIDGEQTANFNDKFTIDAGTTECKNATYTGTVSGATTTTASAKPIYKECTSTFESSVTIDPNGCEYVFHGTASVDIECPGATKYIAVTAFGCEVTVPQQTGITGTIEYTNHGSGSSRHITVHVTLDGITYEEHKKGFFPTCENSTILTHNGVYHGSATIKGTTTGGASTGIWYA